MTELFLGFFLCCWLATSAALAWSLKELQAVRETKEALVEDLDALRSRSRLTQGRGLNTSVNQHFLFNALNAIRFYVRTDSHKARSLLLDFSEYLKSAVNMDGQTTFGEEIELITAYLNLEQARLGEAFSYQLDPINLPTDPTLPSQVLQPLVSRVMTRSCLEGPSKWKLEFRIEDSEGEQTVVIKDSRLGAPLESAFLDDMITRLDPVFPGARFRVEESLGLTICLILPKGH